jgi:hypothetical protein
MEHPKVSTSLHDGQGPPHHSFTELVGTSESIQPAYFTLPQFPDNLNKPHVHTRI